MKVNPRAQVKMQKLKKEMKMEGVNRQAEFLGTWREELMTCILSWNNRKRV